MTLSLIDLLKLTVPPVLFVGIVLVGVPYVKSRPISYQASAKIWIQAQVPTGGGDKESQSSLYLPLGTFFNSPIKTAAELIRSDVVLDQAVDYLKKSMPEGSTCPSLDELRESVKTEEVKDTDVLVVRYTDADPKRSFLILQGVLEGFVKLNSTQSSASALRSREFLEQLLHAAKAKLAEARGRVRRFQQYHGKTDLPQETVAAITRMYQVEHSIEDTRSEIARFQQMISYLQQHPPEPRVDKGLQFSGAMVNDPVVKSLQDRLAAVQMELSTLEPRLKDTHPMIISLKSSQEKLEQALRQRGRDIREGKVTSLMFDTTSTVDPLALESTQTLAQYRKELSGLESVLGQQLRGLAVLKSRVRELPEQHLQFAELKHDEEHNQKAVSDIELRLDSARQVESVASGVTNIQIIDRPRLPTEGSGPGVTLLFAATALVAAGVAVGAYFFIQLLDPSISNIRQLVYRGFPAIAAMGSLAGTKGKPEGAGAIFDRLRLALLPRLSTTRLLLLMSATPGEGKTLTTAGLARSFAAAGRQVVILETGSKGPFLSDLFGAAGGARADLAQYMEKGLEGVIQQLAPGVSIVSSVGSTFSWSSAEAGALIADLEKHFDVVIIDTDSLVVSSSSLSMLAYNVLPVLLVRMKRTTRSAFSLLVRQLSLQGVSSGAIVCWDANPEVMADTPTLQQTAPKEEPAEQEDAWV